jgi:hypothetical protein
MHDVTAGITAEYQPVSVDLHQRLLEAMAAVHANFWEAAELTDPSLGLCTMSDLHNATSLQTAHQVVSHTSPIPQAILEGWPLLLALLERDVADVLGQLMADPQSLYVSFSHFPCTLVHGDWKLGNLGSLGTQVPQIAVLDWQLATFGPMTIDLAWYLVSVEALVPISYESSIEHYRRNLAQRLGGRFDERWWQPMLELGMVGHILRLGFTSRWDRIHDPNENAAAVSHAMVKRFNHQVRSALRWL